MQRWQVLLVFHQLQPVSAAFQDLQYAWASILKALFYVGFFLGTAVSASDFNTSVVFCFFL